MSKTRSEIAYQILREKPACKIIFEGIDFFECSRFFLWDIIGRALRSSDVEFQYEIKYLKELQSSSGETQESEYTVKQRIKTFLKSIGRKKIWLPVATHRLNSLEKKLKKESTIRLVRGVFDWNNYQSANSTHLNEDERIFVDDFFESSKEVFSKRGLSVLERDLIKFKSDLIRLTATIKSAKKQLNQVKPDLILTHVDNHPPYNVYTLLARSENIPVFMVQHGLDCEHFLLEEAYATDIAVWGKNRRDRYRSKSTFQPNLYISGNPEYDKLQIASEIQKKGKENWLWVMRPHASEKCYSPSRTPFEAINILKSLRDALLNNSFVSIVLKPHPFTDIRVYEGFLNEYPELKDRMVIYRGNKGIEDLICESDLVLSEDSTTLLDACILGKPLIHLNYSGEDSTIDTRGEEVCWYATNKKELEKSIVEFFDVSSESINYKFNSKRISFVEDHASKLDGEATKRVIDNIKKVVGV